VDAWLLLVGKRELGGAVKKRERKASFFLSLLNAGGEGGKKEKGKRNECSACGEIKKRKNKSIGLGKKKGKITFLLNL